MKISFTFCLIAAYYLIESCNATVIDTEAQCGSQAVNITVEVVEFNGGASLDTHSFVIAPDKLLSYQLTSDFNFCAPTTLHGNGVEFSFNVGECFPVVTETADDIIYSYTVWAVENVNQTSQFLRYQDLCLNATCTYPNNANVTAVEAIQPLIRKFSFPQISGDGSFDLTFNLFEFKNETVSDTFSLDQVMVPDYIYGEINANVPTDNFILQAKTCWASPTISPTMETSYPIIEEGCAADNDFDSSDAIEILLNYNQTVRFRFRSFEWTNFTDANQMIYVHCRVDFCDVTSDEDCLTNPCMKRKRRSVETKNSHVISVGPMTINTDLCARDNGGCEELCNMVNGEKRCSCLGDKIIGEDLHSCVEVTEFPQHLNEDWWKEDASMFAWLLVGVMAIVVVATFYTKKA